MEITINNKAEYLISLGTLYNILGEKKVYNLVARSGWLKSDCKNYIIFSSILGNTNVKKLEEWGLPTSISELDKLYGEMQGKQIKEQIRNRVRTYSQEDDYERLLEAGVRDVDIYAYQVRLSYMRMLTAEMDLKTVKKLFKCSSKKDLKQNCLDIILEMNLGKFKPKSVSSLSFMLTEFKKSDDDIEAVVSGHKAKKYEKMTQLHRAIILQLYTLPKYGLPKSYTKVLYFKFCSLHNEYIDSLSLQSLPFRLKNGKINIDTKLACRLKWVNTNTGEEIVMPELAKFQRRGWLRVPFSESLFRKYVSSKPFKRLVDKDRHGKMSQENVLKHKMKLPEKALSLVSADDYRLNFWLSVGGKNYTRATVYWIFDGSTGAMLGYSVKVGSQDVEQMMTAHLDMLNEIKKITGRYIAPAEIEIDGFGRSSEIVKQMYELYTYESYRQNAWGKLVERHNWIIDEGFFSQKMGWTGSNMGARKKDNIKHEDLVHNKNDYPVVGLAELVSEIEKIREGIWNRKDDAGITVKERFLMNLQVKCKGVSPKKLISAFCIDRANIPDAKIANAYKNVSSKKMRQRRLSNPKIVEMRGSYIEVVVEGIKYTYFVDLTKLEKSIRADYMVKVKYIKDDMSRVLLYRFEGDTDKFDEFIGEVELYEAPQRAKIEQTDKDKELHRRYLANKKRLENDRVTKLEEAEITTSAYDIDKEAIIQHAYKNPLMKDDYKFHEMEIERELEEEKYSKKSNPKSNHDQFDAIEVDYDDMGFLEED